MPARPTPPAALPALPLLRSAKGRCAGAGGRKPRGCSRGSTLGNLLGHQILIPMVDIGLAQLAMHSAMETASCKDAEYMAKAVAEFYNTPISQPVDGEWKLGL